MGAQEQEIIIQCKDLYNITSKTERICTALAEQLKLHDLLEAPIVSLRKAYIDTQTATVRLPAEATQAVGQISQGSKTMEIKSHCR